MTFFGPDLRNGLPIGLGSVAGFGIAPQFSPASLFAGGINGAWYDPSDATTLFSDRAGTTPCAAPGAGAVVPVGLMLDKSQGLALGSELVTNGGPGFTTTTGWQTTAATVTANNGKLDCVKTGGGGVVFWTLTTVIGTWYRVNIVWENVDATGPSILVNSSGGLSVTTTNTNATVYFCAVSTSTFVQMQLGSGSPGTSTRIISLSAKTTAGNHAIAANDTTARPELSARVNLLTYSEQFDNGAWSKNSVTVTANAAVAPNGTTTADLMYPSSSGSLRFVFQTTSAGAALYTRSVYAKASGKTIFYIDASGGSPLAYFDLANGTVSNVAANYTATITLVGNGWYRCAVTSTTAISISYGGIYGPADAAGSQSVTANGTDGVLLWGADLRPTNIGSQIPAYQRVADANTYDSTGFPRRLVFNGTSSAMSTPANVNLSGTDKATVFLGLRKANDNNVYVPLEFSNASGWTIVNGSFAIYAPSYLSGALPAPKYFVGLRGSSLRQEEFSTFTAPITNVLSESMDISAAAGSEISMRINGAVVSPSAASGDAGSSNFGNYPISIGTRLTGSAYFPGDIYSLIVVGSAVSAGNITATETWVNGKTGGVY